MEGGETFLQAYNAENRLSGVLQVTGDCDTLGDTLKAWQFTYDGDGAKVKQEYTDSYGTLTTYYYAGGSYEVQSDGSTEITRQYYALAGVSAGMREGSSFSWFLTDHLGSVVGVTDADAILVSQTRYTPFGEIRSDVGMVTETDYGYTFQRNVSSMGLMDYKARYYSPLLGRFTQPDTLIPGLASPQMWNRYSYVNNNPIDYTDPDGHKACDEEGNCFARFNNPQLPKSNVLSGSSGVSSKSQLKIKQTKNSVLLDKRSQGLDTGDFVPSVIGINLGASWQIGMFAEAGSTIDVDAFLNLRSGQFSLGYTSGPMVYGGTPSLLGGAVYIGGTSIYHLSDNINLEGYSDYTGGTVAGDGFGKFGFSFSVGQLRDGNDNSMIGKPFIDPEQGKAVRFTQGTVNLGINGFANAVDGGVIHGFTKTHLWGTWTIPNWGD